ncbi:(d)CMP kinase [Halalkalibacter akibai]|uniref:Cytidylate kinase n=1 Tax=Halalkalibacter akibai (strain ATCC 43226 / DSM 21942 / CIP 109018 / JCM 9157 / 1139) TaxID=1236973 RepID=W4QRI3_HALA3|nr:(d)CMP kinase [Halalkalibacter akibai]GAE34532.1 cytidylate kinase [Halalkalibacter akibai JCM 9157]
MNKQMNIAIDGPAGAGKSTVAKLVAEQLSFLYIDTGAMYRALTYAALKEGVELTNGQALNHLLNGLTITLQHEKSGVSVLLNDEDVTEVIRNKDVTANVSLVSSHESVRLEMVERQRTLADKGHAVLDGRDIGTFVLPDAKLKVFLTASVEERARRRYEEHQAKGIVSDLEQLKNDIAKRDELDSTREFAPLKQAADAIVIDTTTLSIPEVADSIIELAKERAI